MTRQPKRRKEFKAAPPRTRRKSGSLCGKIRVKPGFKAVDKEIEKMFYGDID